MGKCPRTIIIIASLCSASWLIGSPLFSVRTMATETSPANETARVASSSWAQFRGPTGEGLVDTELPTNLANPASIVWSTETEGTGWSSPVEANGKIWFTTSVVQKATQEQIAAKLAKDAMSGIKTVAAAVTLHAICLDAETGKQLHNVTLTEIKDPEPINPLNSYASPTPAIAGDRVVVHFGNYGTWCLDANSGKQLWNTKFVVDHSVGPGSSPIVTDDKVILVCDGIDEQYVAAVYLKDGKLAWKTDRPPLRATNAEFKKAYSTPLLLTIAGVKMAIIPGAQWTVAYDPSTGKEIWRVDCGDGFSTTPMPIFENGLVVISTGYMRPEFVAIRPDGKGDVSKSHIAWRAARGAPTMPSAIAKDGIMYSISDSGILTSYDMKSGEEINRSRIGGNFSSSPILAGGLIYLTSREGIVSIVSADSSLKTIATHDLGEQLMASPAVVGKDLILRSDKRVVRYTAKP